MSSFGSDEKETKEKVKKIAKYETERVETVLEKIMKQGGNWNE